MVPWFLLFWYFYEFRALLKYLLGNMLDIFLEANPRVVRERWVVDDFFCFGGVCFCSSFNLGVLPWVCYGFVFVCRLMVF